MITVPTRKKSELHYSFEVDWIYIDRFSSDTDPGYFSLNGASFALNGSYSLLMRSQ